MGHCQTAEMVESRRVTFDGWALMTWPNKHSCLIAIRQAAENYYYTLNENLPDILNWNDCNVLLLGTVLEQQSGWLSSSDKYSEVTVQPKFILISRKKAIPEKESSTWLWNSVYLVFVQYLPRGGSNSGVSPGGLLENQLLRFPQLQRH